MDQQNQQILNEIELVLENNQGYGYKVSHCRSADRAWKIMADISPNIKHFKKKINGIINTGSEALKIEVFKNVGVPGKRNSKVEEYILKLVEYPVPLADMRVNGEQAYTPKILLPNLNDSRDTSLAINSALAGIQAEMLTEKNQNALALKDLMHAHEIDKLSREIVDVTKEKDREIESLVRENNELSDAYENALDRLAELEEKASGATNQYSKLAGAGIAMLLGKQMGLEKKETFQLAGLLLGAEMGAIEPNEPEQEPVQNETQATASDGRKTDMRRLWDWMTTLSDEQFMKMAKIIIAIDRDSSLLDVLSELIEKEPQEKPIETQE